MNTREAESSYDTSPIEKEEGLNDRKDDKNKNYDKDKEPECSDYTSTVDMEEGVMDRNDESKRKNMREKRLNSLMTLPLLKLSKM